MKILRPIIILVVFVFSFQMQGKSQIFSFQSASEISNFTNHNGINQDGNLALCRDMKGNVWAVLGHTNMGGLKIWKGSSVDNMIYKYDAALNFKLGAAGIAFNNINYPDGPKSRGQVWPFGLYIGSTGKFYCYIHNETGWASGGTGYTINGQFEGEPDFRHIGLMTSLDSGRTWNFDGWIITSSEKSFTTKYLPEPELTGAQVGPQYSLGAGDHSLFVNPNDKYMYLFYTKIYINSAGKDHTDSIYVARAPKNNPTIWTKWYKGGWGQSGNSGKESAVIGHYGYGPSVAWSTYLNKYILISMYRPVWNPSSKTGICALQMSVCNDWKNQNWASPQLVKSFPGDSTIIPSAYWTICNTDSSGNIKVVGKTFRLFHNLWANDVKKIDITTNYLNEVKR